MDDRPSSAVRSRTEPGLSAGLHSPRRSRQDALRLRDSECINALVPGNATVATHVLESYPRVDEWIDRRVEVEVLLALPRPGEPVDDPEAVGAHHDSPSGVVPDACPDAAQGFAYSFQLLTIVGRLETTAGGFVDGAVSPFDAVGPRTGSGVSGAGAVGVSDHGRGHGARIRSQFAHWVSPLPVRTARRSSLETGMWQPAQKSPASPVTAGRRRAAIRADSARW